MWSDGCTKSEEFTILGNQRPEFGSWENYLEFKAHQNISDWNSFMACFTNRGGDYEILTRIFEARVLLFIKRQPTTNSYPFCSTRRTSSKNCWHVILDDRGRRKRTWWYQGRCADKESRNNEPPSQQWSTPPITPHTCSQNARPIRTLRCLLWGSEPKSSGRLWGHAQRSLVQNYGPSFDADGIFNWNSVLRYP